MKASHRNYANDAKRADKISAGKLKISKYAAKSRGLGNINYIEIRPLPDFTPYGDSSNG